MREYDSGELAVGSTSQKQTELPSRNPKTPCVNPAKVDITGPQHQRKTLKKVASVPDAVRNAVQIGLICAGFWPNVETSRKRFGSLSSAWGMWLFSPP